MLFKQLQAPGDSSPDAAVLLCGNTLWYLLIHMTAACVRQLQAHEIHKKHAFNHTKQKRSTNVEKIAQFWSICTNEWRPAKCIKFLSFTYSQYAHKYRVTSCQMKTANTVRNHPVSYVVLSPVVPSAFPPPFGPLPCTTALQAHAWNEMSKT